MTIKYKECSPLSVALAGASSPRGELLFAYTASGNLGTTLPSARKARIHLPFQGRYRLLYAPCKGAGIAVGDD